MDLQLKDKSVLVFAAGSGIGRGVALEFAKENAKVMILGRTEEKLRDTQQYILHESGNKVEFVTADLTNKDHIKNAVNEARKNNGPIYAVFNNTGGPKPGLYVSLRRARTARGWLGKLRQIYR